MDERLLNIQKEQQNALTNSNNMYQGILDENKALYDQQKDYLNKQEQIMNDNLDKQLANQTQKIEKQKEVAKQAFETESKKALNDYTSFTNPYGYQAEAMANQGLSQSGVSETAKLGGFNAYQNRLASANKVMQDAFTSYDMAINDAILNNDVTKAENALNKLNQSLAYMESYYSNKATITQNQFNTQQDINNNYFNRYQTEYQNIQNEQAQAEAIRQFNKQLEEEQRQYNQNMAYQKSRDKVADSQWQKEYDLAKKKSSVSSGSSGNSSTPVGSAAKEETVVKGINTKGQKVSTCGNDKKTQAKNDYYFDNNYQPRYYNNKELTQANIYDKNLKLSDLVDVSQLKLSDRNVWYNGTDYVFWDGVKYITLNDEIRRYKGAMKPIGQASSSKTTKKSLSNQLMQKNRMI